MTCIFLCLLSWRVNASLTSKSLYWPKEKWDGHLCVCEQVIRGIALPVEGETEATEADRFCRVVRIRFSLRREPQMDGTLSLVVYRQSRVRLSANVRRPKEMEKKRPPQSLHHSPVVSTARNFSASLKRMKWPERLKKKTGISCHID